MEIVIIKIDIITVIRTMDAHNASVLPDIVCFIQTKVKVYHLCKNKLALSEFAETNVRLRSQTTNA